MKNNNLLRLIIREIGDENKKNKNMITYSNHIKEKQQLIIIAVPIKGKYKNLFKRLNIYENRHLIKCEFFSLDWDDFDNLCEWYEVELL